MAANVQAFVWRLLPPPEADLRSISYDADNLRIQRTRHRAVVYSETAEGEFGLERIGVLNSIGRERVKDERDVSELRP